VAVRWGLAPVDPPREQAKATIASAVQMGVKVKNGHRRPIGHSQGNVSSAGHGHEHPGRHHIADKQKKAETAASIEKADGFAQVFPEDKYNIVDVLQKHGHIVGMTGDGSQRRSRAQASELRHRGFPARPTRPARRRTSCCSHRASR